MSREFHWVDSNYMHEVLARVKHDRPETGEPVADAIREMLIALAPVEYAVAGEQACDTNAGYTALRLNENAERIQAACERLMRVGARNRQVIVAALEGRAAKAS